MVPYSPFGFYKKRKIYIHNMGHSICAYLGLYTGVEYIHDSINNPNIELIVRLAMQESMEALSKEYDVNCADISSHIDNLIYRFTNNALMDTCKRVGKDTARKLSKTDRLIGAARFCIKNDITPTYTIIGIAAAVYQHLEENKIEQTINNAIMVLENISELKPDEDLTFQIIKTYKMFNKSAALEQLKKAAVTMKMQNKQNIV